MDDYPKYVEAGFELFDPLELAKSTEGICCKEDSRKYTDFYCTGVYGGTSTGYLVGCCLRCVFCWVDLSRELPHMYGHLCSAQVAFDRLIANATKAGVSKLRVSGGEPTLGKEHLLGLLRLVASTNYVFILETNGVLLGADPAYVEALKDLPNIHVRVSLKAGTAEGFEGRTGAKGEFYGLPYRAIERLRAAGVSFHVAAMTDARLMKSSERQAMARKLKRLGYSDYFEEEAADPYQTSVMRLRKAGFEVF